MTAIKHILILLSLMLCFGSVNGQEKTLGELGDLMLEKIDG